MTCFLVNHPALGVV